MKKTVFCLIALLSANLSADSINLFNDSSYTLKAVVYDANGTLMGEFVLNPRDAAEWNNNSQEAGADGNYQVTAPYTVDWLCTQGAEYGSCNYVAAGATVTAQSCGGTQQCPDSNTNPPESPLTKGP